jgi:purine-cytosine permease-like protein
MLNVISIILLFLLIPTLLVLYYYYGFRAIEAKSKWMMVPIYFRVGIRVFLVLLWIYLLWNGIAQITDWWSFFALLYIVFDVIKLIILSRKVESWRTAKKS